MSAPASPRIAVLLDHIETDYHLEILSGIRKAAARVSGKVIVVAGGSLGRTPESNVRNFIYDQLPESELDGWIVLSGCLSNEAGASSLFSFIEQFRHKPLVTIGAVVPGFARVVVDNEPCVTKLVEHLIDEHRAKKIVFFSGPSGSLESESRFAGYRSALLARGIAVEERLVVQAGLTRREGAQAVRELLDVRGFSSADVDAIVCFNDDLALGVLDELHRRNIGVPQPIAVVGFDDAASAPIANPPLSTVGQRARDQGEVAAEALLRAIATQSEVTTGEVETRVVLRESCGCRSRLRNDSRKTEIERPRVARTCRLALIERRAVIRTQLSRAAEGRMVGSPDWEGRLIDGLAAQIDSEEGGAFGWEFERLARIQGLQGGDLLVCHDVLTALRLQALACAEVEPGLKPLLEDLFQEGRVMLARVAAAVTREHFDSLHTRLRTVRRVCLEQLSEPNLPALASVLESQLPELGIESFCLTRPLLDEPRQLEVLAVLSKNKRALGVTRLSRSSLGLDPALEQQPLVVLEPLTAKGQVVGIAAFSWGAVEPTVYEELRELLGVALYASQRTWLEEQPA